jgi:hypothetical protein
MSCKRSIFGWSAGPGGSQWYRLALPLAALKSLYGWEVEVSTGYPENRVNSPADIVVVQRPMTEVAQRTMRHWSRKSLTMVVAELDDDMWSIPPDNPAHRLAAPELLGRLDACLGYADLVTVSTTYLAEVVSKRTTTPIRVVGNYVPAALVDRPRRARRGHKITVGWAGSPTHLGDWQANAAGICRALDYSNKIDFHMIGADYSAEVANTLRAIRHTPFQQGITDYYDALDFHVALAPLARTEFNLSKSDIRILESAAIGSVPVMSNWGPYAKVSGRHVYSSGTPVRERDNWRQHIADLVSSPQQLHDERGVWKEWAKARTIETNVHRWHDIYEGALSSGQGSAVKARTADL